MSEIKDPYEITLSFVIPKKPNKEETKELNVLATHGYKVSLNNKAKKK